MTRKPLTAMLTLAVCLVATGLLAGCGSSGGSSAASTTSGSVVSTSASMSSTPATSPLPYSSSTARKHKSKPAY